MKLLMGASPGPNYITIPRPPSHFDDPVAVPDPAAAAAVRARIVAAELRETQVAADMERPVSN
jgi:hypothetical protein